MTTLNVEDKLAINKYDIDRDVHIKVNGTICNTCQRHYCLYACPANCYKLTEEHITYSYEGCLECGSCRVACTNKAIDWTIPRPGFGICYEFG